MAMPWARKSTESSTHPNVNPFYRAFAIATSPSRLAYYLTHPGQVYAVVQPRETGYRSTSTTEASLLPTEVPKGAPERKPPENRPFYKNPWIMVPAALVLLAGAAAARFGPDVYRSLNNPKTPAATKQAPDDVIKRNTSGQIKLPNGETVQIAEPASTPTATPGAEARYPTATIGPTEPAPTAPPTVPAPTQAYPTATPEATAAPAQPAPKIYWKTDDGLAGLECQEDCSDELVKPYLDQAYQTAVSEGNKPFNGVVADAYKYVDGKLVKVNGKKLLRRAERDGLILEMECAPVDAIQCDSKTVERITNQSEEAYRFIMATLKPSKNPGIYVTVSADGKRANVTTFDEVKYPNHVALLRKSLTSFYPWHVTDDWGQMTQETAVKIAIEREYFDPKEGFLFDWVGTVINVKKIGRPPPTKIGDYFVNRSVPGLSEEVYNALVIDGLTDSQVPQFLQKLERKKVTWEQFVSEAETIVGKRLPTLRSLDAEVKLYRELELGKNKQSSNTKDRNNELARIFEQHPDLNTPAYIRTYYEQFA